MPTREQPRLSVVIPAFNEEARLGPTLQRVVGELTAAPWPAEVLVVVDGATDRTAEIAAACARAAVAVPVRVLVRPVNEGKGGAVRRGMLEASGEIRLFCDADLSTPIEVARHVVDAFDAGADVVIASRRLAGSRLERRQPWLREALGRAFSAVVARTLLPGIGDSQCGFKAFTARAAQEVFSRQRVGGFCFDVELLVIARQLGLRIVEYPVTWTDDPRSGVRPLPDGVAMLRDLVRIHGRQRRGEYRA